MLTANVHASTDIGKCQGGKEKKKSKQQGGGRGGGRGHLYIDGARKKHESTEEKTTKTHDKITLK